jgi:hypothetical protein
MDSNKYEPMRVRAWLRAPVVSDEWLPLDGVLLYQHTRADLGERVSTIPGASRLEQPKGGAMIGGRLPIKIVHGRDWYYRCSWAQWGPHIDGQDHWSKRFDMTRADLVDFGGKRGRIDTSSSTYKAYQMPVYYRSALWVEWYCVADVEMLALLVYMTTHLGKKTSQGWGRVLRWEIDPVDKDWSIWRDGRLMRGIPTVDMPRDYISTRTGLYGIRPGYWDKRNQVELALP